MVHREVYYGKPYNQRNNDVKSCPSTFLDKNINIAAELDITKNEKKYSPGSNFAKWMLQEIKRLILNIMSGSRSVNTEILDYFHPMPGTENNGNRTGWRQLERMSISKSNKQVISHLILLWLVEINVYEKKLHIQEWL